MLSTFLFTMNLIGCGDKETETGEENADNAIAAEIWMELSDLDSWNQAAGWEGVVASGASHSGDYMQIWLNDLAYEAISSGAEIPDGGMIVKESSSDAAGTTVLNYTVMKKITGYNPDAADWFWVAYDSSGSINMAGAPDYCIGCHSSTEDYLQFTHLD